VREVERRIQQAGQQGELQGWRPTLDKPNISRPPDGIPQNLADHTRLMCDILVLAFQTDTTRVCTLKLNNDHSYLQFPHLSVEVGHHELSHSDRRKADKNLFPHTRLQAVRVSVYGLIRLTCSQRQGRRLQTRNLREVRCSVKEKTRIPRPFNPTCIPMGLPGCNTGDVFQMVRVNFLVATAVGITSLLVGAGVTAAVEPKFDIEVPYGFAGPLSCKDTRLFAVDRMTMTRLFSSDGGQTWKKVGPLVDSKGRPILRTKEQRGHLPSLIRLASGAMALKYDIRSSTDASKLNSYITRSTDEAATWSEPVLITRPRSRSNAMWLIQTQNGRLVLPTEYWFTQPDDRGIGICTTFYSDDEGRSWRESRDTLWVWEKGGAWQGACEVPTVIETSDGRLLMFMRTWYQRIAQSYSKDGAKPGLRQNSTISRAAIRKSSSHGFRKRTICFAFGTRPTRKRSRRTIIGPGSQRRFSKIPVSHGSIFARSFNHRAKSRSAEFPRPARLVF